MSKKITVSFSDLSHGRKADNHPPKLPTSKPARHQVTGMIDFAKPAHDGAKHDLGGRHPHTSKSK